jgi:choline dehydrogenase-like flavoprotein
LAALMALKHVNAVVVGSGAGGGIVAKELASAGLTVVLLERGKWYTAFDDRKDDLRNQRTCVLGNSFGPDERNPRVYAEASGQQHVVQSNHWAYSNNAACVGGGTLSYGAMAWRFMEEDFRLRSKYGTVAGSTLDDWPITYSDLEPYYEKAEWEIGVSGDDSNNVFRAPRNRPLPMPALPPNLDFQVLEPAAKRLGLHPFHIPMLRNSVPYNGRGACMRCRWCVGYACEVSAKCGTQNTVIPKAIETGNCELRAECIAREVMTDESGRVRGVAYYDGAGKLREQTSDLVVVSCSAVESARLLLNSTSRLFPNGLGNRYDWVGRNLQGHSYTGAAGLFEQETYDDLGPGASIAICDFNHNNPGFVAGGLLANEFLRSPYQIAAVGGEGIPRWGAAHKDFMRRYFKRNMTVMGPMQEMPVFDSRVQVDPKVKDAWGIPVARISGRHHENDLKGTDFMRSKAEAWLKEAGAIKTIPFHWTYLGIPSGGQHQAGTCRMGSDPRTSVVDKFCRVHDSDNLYVIDGSVHPNNGGFNPVLTIMAIAYYASENLVNTWKGTHGRG